MRTLFLTAAISVLASGAASALDLPVSYNVDARAMKRAAVAGNTLTFEVYEDSDCTSLIHSESIDVAGVQILLEELKTMRVKGGPKQPRLARLTTTLEGVFPMTPDSSAFLRLTGEGVVPVGGSCQAQSVTVLNGPSGPTGPSGPGLTVVDAEGVQLGVVAFDDAMGHWNGEVAPYLIRKQNTSHVFFGTPVYLGAPFRRSLFFTSSDCSGRAFAYPESKFTSGLAADYVMPLLGLQLALWVNSSPDPNSTCTVQDCDNMHLFLIDHQPFESVVPSPTSVNSTLYWKTEESCESFGTTGTKVFTPPSSCCVTSPEPSNRSVVPIIQPAVLDLADFTLPLSISLQ